jgi:hypothetical protein
MSGKMYVVEYQGVTHEFKRSSNKYKKIGKLHFREVDGVMVITDGKGGIIRERFDKQFIDAKEPETISSVEYNDSRSMPMVNSKGAIE